METRSRNCIMFAFGDSITYGMWEEQGGWVERLRRKIERQNVMDDDFNCLLYNMGIPGDTTAGLLERLQGELQTRIREGFDTVVLIAIGINDAALEGRSPRITLDAFDDNLQTILGITREHSARIALPGLNPVDESKVNPLPNGSGIAYLNTRIPSFNQVIAERAVEEGLPFIDTWGAWHAHDVGALLVDGLHPNEKGHALNAQLVENYLKEQIAIDW